MSDNETKNKARGGNSWSEHEVLVYLLSAIEHNNIKVDFANSPAPAGRNANGCSQKIFKTKIALRAEIDAIKNGDPLAPAAAAEGTTPKKATPRKRKAVTEEDGEGTPKKRGRAKKGAAVKAECEDAGVVKEEPQDDVGASFEAQIEEQD